MRTLLKILLMVTLLAGVVGFSQPAAAQQEVTVRVRSIAASKTGDSFDSRLNDLKGKLTRAFGGYTSFKQVGDSRFQIKEGQSESVSVPGGTSVRVTFHGVSGDFYRLGLAIGDKLRTTLRASPGSTFFQAGLDYKDGMLILAITAD